MECISATNLCRKSGQWGTRHLLPVRQKMTSYGTTEAVPFVGCVAAQLQAAAARCFQCDQTNQTMAASSTTSTPR